MKPSLSTRRGRPTDASKSTQILGVAKRLFMQQGFYGTSMDEIARQAGMSKLTLYRRFPDKNALFEAVIREKCDEFIPDRLFDVFDRQPPREAIYTFGKALLSLITSDEVIRLHRMMAAEAEKTPALTELFYNTGPKRGKMILHEKLRGIAERKELPITDPDEAGQFLVSLFTGSDLYMQRLMNLIPPPSEAEMGAYARKVTEFFLRSYCV